MLCFIVQSVKNEVNIPVLKKLVEDLYSVTVDMTTKRKHTLVIFCPYIVVLKQLVLLIVVHSPDVPVVRRFRRHTIAGKFTCGRPRLSLGRLIRRAVTMVLSDDLVVGEDHLV